MTFSNFLALFGAMLVLAALPSVSVLAVSARAAASGFRQGVATSLGIVAGDIIFILIALIGLAVIAERMGTLFVLIKYLGGAYLIWLGTRLWQAEAAAVETERLAETSYLSSFLTGLFITLADQKAILFYLGFFPAFIDLTALTAADLGIIIAVTLVAVGGVKLVYAYLASRAGLLISAKAHKGMNMLAGVIMVLVGLVLIFKA